MRGLIISELAGRKVFEGSIGGEYAKLLRQTGFDRI
jgi:hypothetical protein